MGMTSRARMLAALERRLPDRLPVTTHHLMPYFVDKYMGGVSFAEVFDEMGMEAIDWVTCLEYDEAARADHWRLRDEEVSGTSYATRRYTISTPKGEIGCVLQSNDYTSWLAEHFVKEKRDMELIAEYWVPPRCGIAAVNEAAARMGERGIVRGHVASFDVYGQPGCWQDFCCLRGTEKAIMDSFDDPEWVHESLAMLRDRKLGYIASLAGAEYDLIELGGGDASTTVISPSIFEEFVAPYDAALIEGLKKAGKRSVYHTCGGMMPILEAIADMGPDAMETFTPPDMGGDARLAEAKARIGARVCMIGGFDQGHRLVGCSERETRGLVRRCFEEAGGGGGYIIAPSDHFFDAEPALLKAFADEARSCVY
jgi:uroporphyrinogen decarboxylase